MIETSGKNIILRTMTKKELRALLNKINTKKPFSDEETDMIFSKMEASASRSPIVGIFTKNGEVMGMLTFDSIVFSEYRCDISVMLANKTYCRRGFGTEALLLAKKYAKESFNLKKMYANVSSKDIASQALYKKCGFLHSKTFAKGASDGGDRMVYVSML